MKTTTLLALALTLGTLAAPVSHAQTAAEPAAQEESTETEMQAENKGLTFDQIFETPRPGAWPKQIHWSPDGARLTYLMPVAEDGSEDQGVQLWSLDAASGESQPWFRNTDLPAAGEDEEDEARSIDGYQFFGADGLLVESSGELFVVKGDKPPSKIAGKDAAGNSPQEAKLSPDGKHIAFLRGPDLYLLDVASGKERALTTDGKEGEILNGQTDWVYWEEIHGRTSKGFWWSPDSTQLAYYRFDDRKVPIYTLLDSLPQYPKVTEQRYPKAGETNPIVQVGVLDITAKKGKTVWLETGEDADTYLARVTWLPNSQNVAIQRLNRDQNQLDLLRCSATDGSCSTLLTDTSKTWINVGDELTFLKDGRFIWSSEETGWKHLYLHAADGSRIRAITAGQLSISSLNAVDEAGDRVIFTAPISQSAGFYHRGIWQANLSEPMKIAPLTRNAGWHSANIAPGARHWVRSVSTSGLPTVRDLLSVDGEPVAELPRGPAPSYDPASLPQWEFIFIWGLGGARLPARIMKPPTMEPGKKYPVIMYQYGCPESQTVSNRWSGQRDLWHKMMAQRGYVIFGVDGVTSNYFGKRGADKAHRLFGPSNLDAQESGVAFLKSQNFVDPDRIGIWGWSGGGSNTLGVLLSRPGLWAAGVSGAPVTDWHLYDTIWTERYLDHPKDNPEGYKNSSPINMADKLQDPLLIVHGTADDNVHPQNTLAMVNAFIEAGVAFEQAIYPGQKHGFRGKASRHFYERMTEFFDRHLAEEADSE